MDDVDLPAVVLTLLSVVEARPDDVALRLHTAELLVAHGCGAAAVAHCAHVLGLDPGNQDAIRVLSAATTQLRGDRPTDADRARGAASFDWHAAEAEVADVVGPSFVQSTSNTDQEVERPAVVLSDVTGLDHVKQRLELGFLTPMRNPEMRNLYGRSLPGGLLLYGPPGCGKTFLARAVAGELGARFYPVELSDVLDMWIGASERNLHTIFETARRNAPCVLFFDEIDALGHKRAQLGGGSAMRGAVNQLLIEMDSVKGHNDGVFILGATNQPWDVDSALLRPGRFDRVLLVEPPDSAARESILRFHLRDRPVESIDVAVLARRSEHFSGADLAHLCDSAAERAMWDSVRSNEPRPIGMTDFEQAFTEVKPSTGPWLHDARNVVMFANSTGRYDDLLAYLKRRNMA